MAKVIDKIKSMNHYIRMRQTGKPNEFAKKLDISRSTMFEYMNLLKENGAPIEYDSRNQSYYYKKEGDFEIKFVKFL